MLRFLKKALVLSVVAVVAGTSSEAFAQQQTLGYGLMQHFINNSILISEFLDFFAYIAGLFFGVVAIFKFKDHVENPANNPLSAGVKRFIAGGMFLSLPFMSSVVQHTLFGNTVGSDTLITDTGALWTGTPGELDQYVINFVSDIAYPTQMLITFFNYVAATILLIVGISRLTRKMDEGPRGPAGLGTIMTFITSGILFTSGDAMGAMINTIFGYGDGYSSTNVANINADLGLSTADMTRLENVIQAVMYFVLIVGMIAFVRGWFVLRAFADGQQGATLAQGLVFLVGGGLAMNLGEVVNAVQASVGIAGITFN